VKRPRGPIQSFFPPSCKFCPPPRLRLRPLRKFGSSVHLSHSYSGRGLAAVEIISSVTLVPAPRRAFFMIASHLWRSARLNTATPQVGKPLFPFLVRTTDRSSHVPGPGLIRLLLRLRCFPSRQTSGLALFPLRGFLCLILFGVLLGTNIGSLA